MFSEPFGRRRSAGIGAARSGVFLRWLAPVVVCIVALGLPARAEQPGETLKRHIDEGLRILRHGASDPDRSSLPARLEAELVKVFDFTEFSRRVLATHWARFTPPQRAEFVDVFSQFLTKYYLVRLQQYYTDEKVVAAGQEIPAPGRAVVRLQVIWKNQGIPVEVRLLDRGAGWKAYDVSVVGISAVQIYRAQFQEILSRQSPAETIDMIRQRLQP
jgi:phospholipid transport system substrate-binding protein